MTTQKPQNAPEMDLTGEHDIELAANKLYGWAREKARQLGQDPDQEVQLWSPERAADLGYGRHWRVSWEAGPHEWGVHLTCGESMYSSEFDGSCGDPQVAMLGNSEWYGEPHYSFDVGFISK